MRIIGGKFGGRVIRSPKGLPVRPTTDRVKEALFNRLAHQVELEGIIALDLFAGTGNISLELWSRGADRVVSVDQHGRCVSAIRAHLHELGLGGGEVLRMEASRFVHDATDTFDLIFMDPPYAMAGQPALVQAIWDRDLLAPGGILVVEHAPQLGFQALPGFVEQRDYGSSCLSFFEAEEESQ
jgi:16S rRNA (guanine966-N2)-methyltransferase